MDYPNRALLFFMIMKVGSFFVATLIMVLPRQYLYKMYKLTLFKKENRVVLLLVTENNYDLSLQLFIGRYR